MQKINFIKSKFISFGIIILFFVFRYTVVAQQDSVANLIDFQTRKFRFLLETLYDYSKDTVDIISASDSAFSAMLKSVNLQNAYYTKNIWAEYLNSNLGKSKSIGITASILGDTVFVVEVDKNSPAEKAGIFRGSIIISVNDVVASHSSIDNNYKELISQLECNIGDTVTIKLKKHNSDEIITKKMVCFEYAAQSITGYFVFPKERVAYVQISHFSTETDKEFKELLSGFKKNKISAVIIDLRNNPGGAQSSVLSLLDEFISEGDTLSKMFARKDEFKSNIIATSGGSFETLPVIVLTNKKSASASEVFAGAIQDLDRGIVIGERTFGKGTVQKMWDFIDTTGYRITISEFLTPSGRHIEKPIIKEKMFIDPSIKLTNPDLYQELYEKNALNELPTRLGIYNTKKKRTIIEYGGVTPDFIKKEDSLTLLTEVLLSKNIILEFVYRSVNILPDIYKTNFEKFIFEYNISDSLLQELRVYSHNTKKIWNEEMFLKDKEIIRNRLKACIAYYFWGKFAYNSVVAEYDSLVRFALAKKNEALNILK